MCSLARWGGGRVALAVEFVDAAVAAVCNCSARIDSAWGEAADDVRECLCVLAASPDLAAYDDHPNVTHQGDRTVFHGRTVDVMLQLTAVQGPPLGVAVRQIDVRVRATAT